MDNAERNSGELMKNNENKTQHEDLSEAKYKKIEALLFSNSTSVKELGEISMILAHLLK